MNLRRTDLAAEARELRFGIGQPLPEGVTAETAERCGCTVETMRILSDRAAAALNKPCGTYLTIYPNAFLNRESGTFSKAAVLLAGCLRELLQLRKGESILVAGLGNEAITPDTLGPRTLRHVLATRHLVDRFPAEFGSFRKISTIAPGVTGNTGVESAELLHALVERIRPDAVLTVDALAARRLSRIYRTIQLTDTGITPGSGVGNARAALNRETLGVPVVAVGVPTVVDAGTLAADLAETAGLEEHPFFDIPADMIVTSREMDARISELSRLLGYAISLALLDGLTLEDLTALIG